MDRSAPAQKTKNNSRHFTQWDLNTREVVMQVLEDLGIQKTRLQPRDQHEGGGVARVQNLGPPSQAGTMARTSVRSRSLEEIQLLLEMSPRAEREQKISCFSLHLILPSHTSPSY